MTKPKKRKPTPREIVLSHCPRAVCVITRSFNRICYTVWLEPHLLHAGTFDGRTAAEAWRDAAGIFK
jgi:hypothetical protein